MPFLTRLDSTPGKVHPAPRSSATSATKTELLQLLPKVKKNTQSSPRYCILWTRSLCDHNIFIVSSFQPQLSKGFVLTPGFPTTATAFTSIVLLKHGPMLRKSAAKKEETSSASTMWRSRALSFLSLDLVHKKHKITKLFLSLFYNVYTVVLSLVKTSVKSFLNTISRSHTFLLSAASIDELWIGFNDIRTEGLFDWSDHSSVSFTSWTFGKPAVSTDAEDCVLITGEVREVI